MNDQTEPLWPKTDGRFRIIRELGEGGFGKVYLAEQDEPVRRQVALKVLKRGMHSEQLLKRFAAESQMLALLNHPNIATVYDVGEFSDGRPYFAMECLDGSTITDYCNQQQLTVRERLSIFRSLCQAIQHAHQKGIIHRDIKPSNVIVTETDDGKPLIKVIDFGIAKALAYASETDGDGETNAMITTLTDLHFGTPQYMSPEQARGDLDIDTRADVYSLGIILYELLTGTTPITKEEVQTSGYADLLKHIRLTEAPKPSVRLDHLGEQLTTVAFHHSTQARALTRSVRREMDWIVMMAIEKERGRRYDSVSSLALDIEHFLKNEPVSAGPPTSFYLTRKFIARHRLAVAALACVCVSIIGGTIVSAMAYRRTQAAVKRESEEQVRLEKVSQMREAILTQSEELAVGMSTELLPALQERGRSDLLFPAIVGVATYADAHWQDASETRAIDLARAHLLWSQGQADAALVKLEEVNAANSQSGDPWLLAEIAWTRGQLLEDLDRAPEALTSYQETSAHLSELAVRPLTVRCLARRALLSDEPDALINEAKEGLSQLLESAPETREAFAELRAAQAANAWKKDERYAAETAFEEAVRVLQRLLVPHPRRAGFKISLAQILAKRAELLEGTVTAYHEDEDIINDLTQAASLYASLLEINPHQSPWRKRRAQLCRRLGSVMSRVSQYPAAHQAYEQALQCVDDPSSIEALHIIRDLAEVELRQGLKSDVALRLEGLWGALQDGDDWHSLRIATEILQGEWELTFGNARNAMDFFTTAHERASGQSKARLCELLASGSEKLDRKDDANKWRQAAVEAWSALVADDPDDLRLARRLADAQAALAPPFDGFADVENDEPPTLDPHLAAARKASNDGYRLANAARYEEAGVVFTKAEALFRGLLEEQDDKVSVELLDSWAYFATRMARWHRYRGTPTEGLAWNEEAVTRRTALWEKTDDLSYREKRMVDMLEQGLTHKELKQLAQAQSRFEEVINEGREMMRGHHGPGSALLLDHLGFTWYHLAAVRADRGDRPAAEDAFIRSMMIRRELLSRHTNKARWTDALNQSRDGLAQILWQQGRLPEAAQAWRALIPLQETLVKWRERTGGNTPAYHVRLINACRRLGMLETMRGQWERALEPLTLGLHWAAVVQERWPENSKHHEIYAENLQCLGKAQLGKGDAQAARRLLEQALEVAMKAKLIALETPIRLDLARAHWREGDAIAAEKMIAIVIAREEPNLNLAEAWTLQADIHGQRDEHKEAVRLIHSAQDLLAGLNKSNARYELKEAMARVHQLGGNLMARCGEVETALDWLDQGGCFWEEQLRHDPDHAVAREAYNTVLRTGLELLQRRLVSESSGEAIAELYVEHCKRMAQFEAEWGALPRAIALCERGLELIRKYASESHSLTASLDAMKEALLTTRSRGLAMSP